MEKTNIQSIEEISLQKIIPEKLAEYRKLSGLSIRKVAELLGLSAGMISFWENGKNEPSYEQLIKLCQIYKIEIADLTPMGKKKNKLSPQEMILIEQYRKADKDVRNVVEKILQITTKK